MAIDWNSIQVRAVDPYSPVDSDNVSAITAAISAGTGRGVCTGFEITLPDNTHLGLEAGVALKDYITIHFIAPVVLDIADTARGPGLNYIVLKYKYAKTDPAPIATIDVIPVGDYDPLWHLILGTCEVDPTGSFFYWADATGRELNPGLLTTSFIGLVDTPDTYTGKAGRIAIVNSTETGLDFVDFTVYAESLGFVKIDTGTEMITTNNFLPIVTNGSDPIFTNP